jgi:hypothetical protein
MKMEKWTVAQLINELKCYPENCEVYLEINGLEMQLDEVDLDRETNTKLILRY